MSKIDDLESDFNHLIKQLKVGGSKFDYITLQIQIEMHKYINSMNAVILLKEHNDRKNGR